MSEMLYLQTERNIKITSPVVTLGDVAQLSCSDGAVLARNQVRRVAHLPDDGYGRYVCSASTLVRLVTEAEEHVDVTHIGEPNFILTYEDPRQKNTWISWCKTILVGILTFIGTAFSIMTFHTDIGIRELFLDVYTRFLPQMTPGFSVLEISYSIGIGLGVVLYFNHFGRRKFTQDPTPLEVEMRVYEDDITPATSPSTAWRLVLWNRTTNSSPLSRKHMSGACKLRCISCAMVRNARSPSPWPYTSLTSLSLSKSNIPTIKEDSSLSRRTSASASAAFPALRFKSPVSSS